MANSLLKWCKMKIRSGYNSINLDGTSMTSSCSSRSDTEILMSADEDFLLRPTSLGFACGRASCNAAASESATLITTVGGEKGTNALHWTPDEDVNCNLSWREESRAHRDFEKREFDFTLYDFHGHGKVTKDDITSLVQSIYEAVGASLSLPRSGSRTVQVKLSVEPPSHVTPPKRSRHHTRQTGADEEDPKRLLVGEGGGSYSRQELLQMLQVSMESNNLFYPPAAFQRLRRKKISSTSEGRRRTVESQERAGRRCAKSATHGGPP